MEILWLVLIGFAAGTLGSMLGLGGGFLVVPALILLKEFEPKLDAMSDDDLAALSESFVKAMEKNGCSPTTPGCEAEKLFTWMQKNSDKLPELLHAAAASNTR